MSKQRITKQEAAKAVSAALVTTREALTLDQVADVIRYGDDSDDEIAQHQLFVLSNVIGEKLHNAFHAVDYVDDYFRQAPQKKNGSKTKTA